MDAVSALRRKILIWYDQQARVLPWRTAPADRRAGVRPDPYRVWLSEIMLQQTTVPHAIPYFQHFTERWPGVVDLAAADDGVVMAAWAGLGYYARARNLLACARAVTGALAGQFPTREVELRALPGIGSYTAAAIAAIAFDQPTNVVDGNIERVMARLHAVTTPLPRAKPELTTLAATWVRDDRPGDWAQALMDLGAGVCRPRAPLCEACPIAADCLAKRTGAPQAFPYRAAKPMRPSRHGVAYVITSGDAIAVQQRPAEGLLGGMLGLPTTDWRDAPWSEAEALAAAPMGLSFRDAGDVRHVFTHFALTLRVFVGQGVINGQPSLPLSALKTLPTLFRKCAERGLENAP